MNIKRAVLSGILLWTLIFFEVSILMFGFNLEPGLIYYITHYMLVIFLTTIAALIYFKGRVKKSAKQGVLLGIVMAITGIILDAIITIPLFIKSYNFFIDIYLWMGIIEVIIICGIIGKLKGK